MFEGDPAPSQPFEDLVSIKSENALGEAGAKRMLSGDYVIIICDPRMQSPELRDTVQRLSSELPQNLWKKLVVINADTPAENRRWMKKSNTKEFSLFSDEKREWMRAYTALGENRWSMTMFILADERLQKIARELDAVQATDAVQNTVKAMEQRRL